MYAANGQIYGAGRDGAVYRLDGSTLTRLTPPMGELREHEEAVRRVRVALQAACDELAGDVAART